MCGIVGAVGAIDDEVVQAVRRMNRAQEHRGPDDDGEFLFGDERGGVCFGFRRLSILDLSPLGHQPMVDEARRNALIFNGEIYNFQGLRESLLARGETFRSQSDTEVILRGYGVHGGSFFEELRGMFGVALFDQERQKVTLARDRVGIKPVFVTTLVRPHGKVVLFSSELRSLLKSGLVEPNLDPRAIGAFLQNGFIPGPLTILKGVSLLPPGHLAELSLKNPEYSPRRFASLSKEIHGDSDRAVAELEEALREVVAEHLVSDVPLGVFLSGGVDSSAIAALACESGRGRVKTFNIAFEESEFDESGYARQVSQALGTEHTEFKLTQGRFQDGLESALKGLDQPTFDGINTYFVSRIVREAGFTVALAGTGGDELFGGYKSFVDLPKAMRATSSVRYLPKRLLGGVAGTAGALMSGGGPVPPQTRFAKLGDMFRAGADPIGLYQTAYSLFTQDFLANLSRPETREGLRFGMLTSRYEALSSELQGKLTPREVSQLELELFISDRLLRDSDAASMAVSLELRVPLLDHRVIDAATRVPDRRRYEPLGRKMLLRETSLQKVPGAIFDRKKAGFVLPIEVWAKDKLAPEIERTFADEELVARVGLRSEALTRLFQGFKSGQKGLYWSRVWAPYVLLDWARRHGAHL